MEEDKVVAFPHFVYSENDPLFKFSDGGFHEQCFMKHQDKDKVISQLEKMYPDQFYRN